MILPNEQQEPLCGPCFSEPSSSSQPVNAWMLPSSSTPPILGVAATLSPWAKLLFVATNIFYFGAAALIFEGHPTTWSRGALCCAGLCASAVFHGCIVAALGAVSAYWHGAQCQLQPPCCRWLYCYSEAQQTSRLHSVRWLKRLVLADIGCSALTTLIGVVCFGPARTFAWLALPLLFFVIGSVGKRRGRYRLYAVAHGLWHVFSAAAIVQIVLDGHVPFAHWL